jgi:hypothetical protein
MVSLIDGIIGRVPVVVGLANEPSSGEPRPVLWELIVGKCDALSSLARPERDPIGVG